LIKLWKTYLALTIFAYSLPTIAQEDTLNQINVTATVTPADSYKVISLDDIETRTTENLSDLLSKETPIYIKSYGGGGLSSISIRGAGSSHTQLYWNGIPINSPTLGDNDLSILPLSFIDQAEVHLGASSIIDGSGGLGGAIQLNTSANYKNKLKTTFIKELGSFGIDKTQLSVNLGSKKFQSKTSLFRKMALNNFEYMDITQEGNPTLQRENSEVIQYGVKQEFYFKPNFHHRFAIKSNYLNSYRQIAPIIGVQSKGEYQTDETLRLLGEWVYYREKSFHHLRMAFISDDLNYVDTSATINSSIKVESYKGSYNFSRFFNHSINLKLQVNAGTDIANSTGFSETKSQNRQSVFVQLEQESNRGYSYNIAFREEVIDGEVAPFVPTIGAMYYITSNRKTSIKVNAARNFKAPSLNDLYWNPGGNVNLLAELGYTAEMELNYTGKKLEASISPYYSLIDNWIQWLPGENGVWSPINVKQVENKGLELSLKKHIKVRKDLKFQFHSSYNFVHSTNKSSIVDGDNSIGKQLIYVPKHAFNITAKIDWKNWAFSYNQTVTSKVFTDATNTTYMPYYAPADVNMSYSLKGKKGKQKSADVGLKIANLYDEDYQIMANRPLPGRWFLLFLKINLSVAHD